MRQIFAAIDRAQDGRAIENLARAYDISTDQAETAVRTVLPELAWRIERNTLSRGGVADLVNALGSGHHARILDDPRVLTDPAVRDDGNAILDHLLGSKDKSRALAASAAQASGLGEGLIKLLLPILAQWLMGALTKGTQGGLGDILSRLPMPGGGGNPPGDGMPRMPAPGGGHDQPRGGGMGGGGPLPMPAASVAAEVVAWVAGRAAAARYHCPARDHSAVVRAPAILPTTTPPATRPMAISPTSCAVAAQMSAAARCGRSCAIFSAACSASATAACSAGSSSSSCCAGAGAS